MKRILALLLAVLLCAAPAFAAEWEEGRSPAKPYEGVPEADLETTLGYLMFYPNARIPEKGFCKSLCIYTPREDVSAGEGMFYFCSEERGEEIRFSFNDESFVTARPMTEAELNGLLWGGGTCFEIVLPYSLQLNEGYFVNLGSGCIVAENGVGNMEIGGVDSWAFRTDSEYGVSGAEYRRPVEDGTPEGRITEPKPGDEVVLDVLLGGEAVSAMLYWYDEAMAFAEMEIFESGTFTGTVLAENPIWGIVFLDEEGNAIDGFELT